MANERSGDPDDRSRRDQRLRHAMDYENPADRKRPDVVQGVGWNFLAGLCLGVLVSAVVWIVGWDAFQHSPRIAYLMWGLPIGKLLAAIAIIFVPRWRGFGIGLLVSVAIGALIFGFMAITTCKI